MQRAIRCIQQFSVLRIPAQFPDHDACELLMRGVACLESNRNWILVGPERIAVIQPRSLRALVAIDRRRWGKRPNGVVRLIAVYGMPRLKQSVVCFLDVGPAVAIKWQPHQQFRRRDAGCLVTVDAALNAAAVVVRWGGGWEQRGK